MFTKKIPVLLFTIIVMTTLLLSACGSQPALPAGGEPAATSIPPTSVPPTSVPPTDTAAPEPTATLEPEIQVNTRDAILGAWSLGTKSTGGMAIDYLIFTDDGTYSWEIGQPLNNRFKKGQKTDSGNFSFEGNQLKIDSTKGCFDKDLNSFPCVGIYEAYVSMQAGTPVLLRLVKVEDDHYYRPLSFSGAHSIVIEP